MYGCWRIETEILKMTNNKPAEISRWRRYISQQYFPIEQQTHNRMNPRLKNR